MFEFQFESIKAFLEMVPHGRYVWPVYILGFVMLGGLSWHSLLQHHTSIKTVRRLIEREDIDESKA